MIQLATKHDDPDLDLGWGERIGFGMASCGRGMLTGVLGSFIMIYMMNVAFIDAGILSIMFAVSRLIDGMSDIVIGNLKNWDVRLYEHTGYVGHIGSVGDYYRCSLDLLNETVHREQFFSDRHIMTKIHDNAPTRYYKSAKVKNSLINSNGNIFGTVENSIVFRNVFISEGAVVRNSIILPGGRVGQNAVVENAIVDKKCIVNDGSIVRGTETSPYVLRKDK